MMRMEAMIMSQASFSSEDSQTCRPDYDDDDDSDSCDFDFAACADGQPCGSGA